MRPPPLQRTRTLPNGFSLRNAGVLLVTPISKAGSAILTLLYSAAISAFAAFLLLGYVYSFCERWRRVESAKEPFHIWRHKSIKAAK